MPRIQGVEIRPGNFAPILRISLEIDGVTIETPAVIDSGADSTIAPAELLEGHPTLNYENLPLSPLGGEGAGGDFELREVAGVVKWREWVITERVAFAEPDAIDLPLLGRSDFFSICAIAFAWHESPPTFELTFL